MTYFLSCPLEAEFHSAIKHRGKIDNNFQTVADRRLAGIEVCWETIVVSRLDTPFPVSDVIYDRKSRDRRKSQQSTKDAGVGLSI